MTIDEVRKVCVVGAGTMGYLISLQCAVRGYDTVLFDISKEVLQQVPSRQKDKASRLVSQGALSQSEVDAGLARITFTTDPARAAENADLLSESVPEIIELKRKVHAQFDQLCPPHTILTTNTSSLLVSEIEGSVRRGDRFAALHFYRFGTIVDIMGGPRTSPETMEILKRFARSLGEVPIVLKKEKDGYLQNTMLFALFQAAILLVIDGYAKMEDVDRSWIAVQGYSMGPFGIMDQRGLDVYLNIAEALAHRRRGKAWKQIADFLRSYVERGDLGVKTGKGFYTYPDATFLRPGFITGQDS